MTRLFREDGTVIPSSVLDVSQEVASRIRKPQLCFLLKTNNQPNHTTPSDSLTDLFWLGQRVKVQGKSIGKGFAGTVRRHHFKSGKASHGNSKAHNKPGSTGMTQDPGRVFAGKLMAGHLGHKNVSVRNSEIVFISHGLNLLALKGSIPGHVGSRLFLFSNLTKSGC